MKKGLIGFLAACTLFQFAVVGHSQKVEAAEASFVKVKENLTDWSGTYLIVYEEGSVAFNGSLTALDAVSNTIEVDIANEKIAYTASLYASAFTIDAVDNGYSVKSMSGNYIGQSSYANGLKQDTLYTHTISLDEGGFANLVVSTSGGDVTLKYNKTSGQYRFRYYKSGQESIALYKYIAGDDSGDVNTDSLLTSAIVSKYYNDGTYTKKSNIYVSDTAEDFELASVFHKPSNEAPVYKDRTTYYTPTALLMGDYDGGFDDINSGYRNKAEDEDVHMWHYSIDSSNKPVDDWKVSNTTIQEFYVTLDKMLEDNYFNGWTYNAGTATYEVESHDDEFVKDFLAFTAPCLEPVVLGNDYKNFFDIVKLEIEEGEHLNEGDYLALRMYVDSTNKGVVSNKDCILSEARIYVGNRLFDEDVRNVTINAGEGGTITCNVDISKPVKLNTELTFTVKPNADFEISTFIINDSDKLSSLDENGQCTWTVKSNVDVKVQFKTTIVDESKYLYDFTSTAISTSELSTATLLDAFNKSVVGTNIVTSVNTISKMYGANKTEGPKQAGLKSGTKSAEGSFTITTSTNVSKVTVVCYAWSSSSGDTVSVNNSTAQKAGASSAATLVFDITPTNSISFKFNKRVVVSSITFE